MENEILLSVITPCFNSAHLYINMLENIKSKALSGIEFIVIDDCSTDNSYSRLVDYVNSTSHNLIVKKNDENKGPGRTRNFGISISSGKYITFLDADDWFSDNFFDEVRVLLNEDYDSVIFDFEIVNEKYNRKISSMFFCEQPKGIVAPNDALVYLKGATAGKIYRNEIIKNNGVEFLSLKRNEDLPFTKTAISYCNKIYYTDLFFYEYYQNSDSLMHNNQLLNAQNAIDAFNYIEKQIGERYSDEIEAIFILECLGSTAQTNSLNMKRKEWIHFMETIDPEKKDYSDNPYVKKYSSYIKTVMTLIKKRSYYGIKIVVYLKKIIKFFVEKKM